jgi:NAD(P)H-quinone oxidoreductase subunit 5
MSAETLFRILGGLVLVCPAALVAAIGVPSLVHRPLDERRISQLTQLFVVVGLLAAIGVLAIMLITGERLVEIPLGNVLSLPAEHFHFTFKFVFDRLSVPFVILTFILCGTTGAFTSKYLHRELGYRRFFILFALFLLGMILSSLAGTIETLFTGWELVGLSSALLVAFFHERQAPVANGLRVWSVYRAADAAFLAATLALHHLTGGGDFLALMGEGAWPQGVAALTSGQALFVGLLLLTAAAGKSALIPFSGWLPRAMEGPTPSSAVFYGALSVHLGAFLMLRVSPLLELSRTLCLAIFVLGLTSALFGALASRVQADVKSALAFASLTQVGIIFVEIALGFRYLALVHIIGHACLRTLQLLRAPNLLHDYQLLEDAIGRRLEHGGGSWQERFSESLRRAVYRMGLERGYLDLMIDRWVVEPLGSVLRRCDRLERMWTDLLSGGADGDSVDQAGEVTSRT